MTPSLPSPSAGIAPSQRSAVAAFIVMDVMEHAARIEAAGGKVMHLEVGQPAAPAPLTARRAAAAALEVGQVSYTAALGMPQLRARIAEHYQKVHALSVDPERVVVTNGSSGGFILAFLALFEAKDRVAIAAPGYPPYRHVLSALGCEPVLIETRAEDRHALTPERLLEAHRQAPLKGVVVASPSNPTGTMMDRAALTALYECARELEIAFISDEIYHGLDYAFPAVSAAEIGEDVTVINSFSKYFCMTGWRVGWMLVPPGLSRTMERLQQNFSISVPTLSQIAATAAFDGRAEMDLVKAGYVENRRILTEGLPKVGLTHFLPADGAFYLYADVSAFTGDSAAFATRMLDAVHVATTPGVDFDPFRGRQFLRLSYAGSAADMREAVERIGTFLAGE